MQHQTLGQGPTLCVSVGRSRERMRAPAPAGSAGAQRRRALRAPLALPRLQAGKLQLWAVDPLDSHSGGGDGDASAAAAPLQELELGDGDEITFAAAMQREPFLLLGCRGGAVRVAHMVNASGSGVTAARQVRALKLTHYSSECTYADGYASCCGGAGGARNTRGGERCAGAMGVDVAPQRCAIG